MRLALALALVIFPASAHAERRAHVGNIDVTLEGDASFKDDARLAGLWLRRLQSILPEGTNVVVTPEGITICPRTGDCLEATLGHNSWSGVFRSVAAALRIPEQRIHRALAMRGEAYTLEVGLTTDRKLADELATLADLEMGEAGFYADGPRAHVLKGRSGYRVIAGAFLTPAQADRARARLVRFRESRITRL